MDYNTRNGHIMVRYFFVMRAKKICSTSSKQRSPCAPDFFIQVCSLYGQFTFFGHESFIKLYWQKGLKEDGILASMYNSSNSSLQTKAFVCDSHNLFLAEGIFSPVFELVVFVLWIYFLRTSAFNVTVICPDFMVVRH